MDPEANCTRAPNPIQENKPILVVVCALYSAVFIVGLLGNGGVLYFLVGRKVPFHFRIIFIGSLTVANLMLILFNLPITWSQLLLDGWIFGEFVCKLSSALVITAALGTCFTLMLIAAERHFAIKNVHDQWLTPRSARLVTAGAWLVAFCFSLPPAVYAVVHNDGYCGSACSEIWDTPSTVNSTSKFSIRLVYGGAVYFVQFALPIIVLLHSCYSVSHKVSRDVNEKLKRPEISNRLRHELLTRRKKVNRMLTVMVVSFVLAWLPLSTLQILLDTPFWTSVGESETAIRYATLAIAFAHVLAMSSVICNPIIYFLLNSDFRQAIRTRNKNGVRYVQTAC